MFEARKPDGSPRSSKQQTLLQLVFIILALVLTTAAVIAIPVVARSATVDAMVEIYKLVVTQTTESVRGAVLAGCQEASGVGNMFNALVSAGIITMSTSSDAVLASLISNRALISNMAIGFSNGLYIGSQIDASTRAPEILLCDPVLTGRNLSVFYYSNVTNSRNYSAVASVGSPYDPRVRPWYTEGAQCGPSWTAPYIDLVYNVPSASFVAPVYFPNGTLEGVSGMHFLFSGLSSVLAAFVPVASSPAGRAVVLTTLSEVVSSSHPLAFGPNAAKSVNALYVVNSSSLPNDTEVGEAVNEALGHFGGSFANVTSFHLISNSDRIIGVYPFSSVVQGQCPQTLPWIVVVSLPLASVLPDFTDEAVSTVFIVLGGVICVLGTVFWVKRTNQARKAHGGDHDHHSSGHHGHHGVAPVSPLQRVLMSSTVASIAASVVVCVLVFVIWTGPDNSRLENPVNFLTNEVTHHVYNELATMSSKSAGIVRFCELLANANSLPFSALSFSAGYTSNVSKVESFLYELVVSLLQSGVPVTQVSVGVSDGFFIAARKNRYGEVHLFGSDASTAGHVTAYPVFPNNFTRNTTGGVSGASFLPTTEVWFEHAEVGELLWTEVYPFSYSPVSGMSMTIRMNFSGVGGDADVVIAMDVSLADLAPITTGLDLAAIGCSVAVIEPELETQALFLTSGDPSAFVFDENGTAVQLRAFNSSNKDIRFTAELLEHYTLAASPADCGVHARTCLYSFPVVVNDFSGVAEEAVTVYLLHDHFGLDVLELVTVPRLPYLQLLFSWHALSVAFVVGAIGTVTITAFWLGSAVVALFSRREDHAGHSFQHRIPAPGHAHHTARSSAYVDPTLKSLSLKCERAVSDAVLDTASATSAFQWFDQLLAHMCGLVVSHRVPMASFPMIVGASQSVVNPLRAQWIDAAAGSLRGRAPLFLAHALKHKVSAKRDLETFIAHRGSGQFNLPRSSALMKMLPSTSLVEPSTAVLLAGFEAARESLVSTLRGEDLCRHLLFESRNYGSFRRAWFSFYSSSLYHPFMVFTSVLHHLLVIIEAGPHEHWQEHPDDRSKLNIANLVFISVFAVHAVSYVYWTRALKGFVNGKGTLFALVVLAMYVDLAIIWASGYTTGSAFIRFPVMGTVLLRPVILLLLYAAARRACLDFVMTMWLSRTVLGLAFSFFVVGSVCGVALFKSEIPGDEIATGFNNFQASFISMLIFVSSADNYKSLVYPSVAHNSGMMFFFVAFSIAGTFFLIAVLIGEFETKYHHLLLHSKEDISRKQRSKYRLGALAVYNQLAVAVGVTPGNAGEHPLGWKPEHAEYAIPLLRWSDVKLFLVDYCKLPRALLLDSAMNAQQRVDFSDDLRKGVELLTHAHRCDAWFVEELQQLAANCAGVHQQMAPPFTPLGADPTGALLIGPKDFLDQCDVFINSNVRAALSSYASTTNVSKLDTKRFQESFGAKLPPDPVYLSRLTQLLVVAHIWLLFLYGSRLGSAILPLLYLTGAAQCAEVLNRIRRIGWMKFWYPALHNSDPVTVGKEKFRVQSNRADVWILLLSALGFGIFHILTKTNPASLTGGNLPLFFLSFPVLRVTLVFANFRRIVLGLLNAIPDFVAMVVALMLVIFEFGVVATWLLAGYFELLPEELNELSVTFDTFLHSVQALYQIICGIGWDEILDTAVNAVGELWACAIFITFFLLIHILFVDVFIGITCDAFMSMSHNDGLEVIMRRRHGRATIQRVVFAYIRRQQRRKRRASAVAPRAHAPLLRPQALHPDSVQ